MKQAATLFLPLALIVPAIYLTSMTTSSPDHAHKSNAAIANANFVTDTTEQSLYQVMIGEIALDREHPEIALANYIAAAKETQDADIAARATQLALGISSLEDAIEPAIIWANADKNNLEAQITTAALFIRLDKIAEAVPFLKRSEYLNPEEAYQYFLIVYRQLQHEADSKRVIAALQMLVKEDSTVPSAHLALAEIYLYQGQAALALTTSQTALKMAPHSVVAIQLVAESLLRAESKMAAQAFMAEQIKVNPNEPVLQQYYAQFLIENGSSAQGRTQILSLIQNQNLTAEELLQYARLSMQAQWFDIAETVLNRARHFPNNQDAAHYFLARLAELQNKPDVAVQWFRQVLTGPFHVLSQIRSSTLLSERKKYDEALTILSHAQPADLSDKKQLVLAAVDILNKAKRYQEAFSLVDQEMQTLPNDVDFHYARSLSANYLNRLDLAETDLRAIIATEPNHVDALNALGFMLADKTARYDDAKALLMQASKLAPNNPSVLDSIGWLYYKMGDYAQSLAALQKAAEIAPDAETAAHLGEVMWKMKDFEGAKRVWRNALTHAPKHETVTEVMQRLIAK